MKARMLGDITLLMSVFRPWLFCIPMLSITVRLPNYDQVISQNRRHWKKRNFQTCKPALGQEGSWGVGMLPVLLLCGAVAAQELLLCKSRPSLDWNPNQISGIRCNDGEAATLRSSFPYKCRKMMVVVCLHQLKTGVKESLYVTDAKGVPITAYRWLM